MRLLLTTTHASPRWGGSEELWAAVADEALSAGHEVAILVPHKGLDAHPKLADFEKRGAEFYREDRVQGSKPRMAWYVAAGAKRFLSAFKPDICLVSLSGTFTFNQGRTNRATLEAIRESGQPYVLVNELARHRDHTSMPLIEAARGLYGDAAAALFVSFANLELVRRQIMHPLPRAAVVQNPVNLAKLEAIPWPSDPSPASLACVARYDLIDKGQERLLAALAEPIWRDRDWTLDFYGRGDDESVIKEMVGFLDLGDRVRVNGHTADIRELWAKHHALVLPSLEEGLPLVLVEAMYCGRPAVAARAGGMAERIVEGESGFLAEASTPRLLHDALERAWSQRDRWHDLGQAAQRSIGTKQDPQPGLRLLEYLVDLHAGQPARTGDISAPTDPEQA